MEPLLCKFLHYSVAHSRNLLSMQPSTTEVHIFTRVELSDRSRTVKSKDSVVGISISKSRLLQVQLCMEGLFGLSSGLCACTHVCTYTAVHMSVCSYLLNGHSYSQKMYLLMHWQRSSVGFGLHFRMFLAILGRQSCWCQLRLTAKVQLVLIILLLLFHFLLPYFIFKVGDNIPLRTEQKSVIYCSDSLQLWFGEAEYKVIFLNFAKRYSRSLTMVRETAKNKTPFPYFWIFNFRQFRQKVIKKVKLEKSETLFVVLMYIELKLTVLFCCYAICIISRINS